MLRQMTKADALDAAEIHCEALAGDFLPSLGKSFLAMLYRCIISTNAGFGIVYEKNKHIVGVALATENIVLFYKRVFLMRFWALTPKVIWAIMLHPSLMKRILETLFYSKQENERASVEAELIAVVLRKAYRRQRIGTKILHAINEEFLRRGVKSYVVRTYVDNKASNTFYNVNGFNWHNSYIMYNRKWNLYKYEINNPKAPDIFPCINKAT